MIQYSGTRGKSKEEPQLQLLHLTALLHHIISYVILDDVENHRK